MLIMKQLLWLASSFKDLKSMPKDVIADFGYALHVAQTGLTPEIAKPFKHLGSGIWELVTNDVGGTFRAIYTVKFPKAIIVLHVFQKKSKSGISTPKAEIELIKERLKTASEKYQQWEKDNG